MLANETFFFSRIGFEKSVCWFLWRVCQYICIHISMVWGVASRESPVDAATLWLWISAVRLSDSADACLAINDSSTETIRGMYGTQIAAPKHGEIICQLLSAEGHTHTTTRTHREIEGIPMCWWLSVCERQTQTEECKQQIVAGSNPCKIRENTVRLCGFRPACTRTIPAAVYCLRSHIDATLLHILLSPRTESKTNNNNKKVRRVI